MNEEVLKYYYYATFMDEKTKAQKYQVTCLRSHNCCGRAETHTQADKNSESTMDFYTIHY
jgi:hypothetical protein